MISPEQRKRLLLAVRVVSSGRNSSVRIPEDLTSPEKKKTDPSKTMGATHGKLLVPTEALTALDTK